MHYDELGSSDEPWQKLAKTFNRYKGQSSMLRLSIPTLPASGDRVEVLRARESMFIRYHRNQQPVGTRGYIFADKLIKGSIFRGQRKVLLSFVNKTTHYSGSRKLNKKIQS